MSLLSKSLRLSALASALVGAVACAPGAPATVSPPAPILVPSGCEQRLEGRWVHAQDPRFVYDARDDGRTLVLLQTGGSLGADGGTPRPLEVVLQRTPQGFAGELKAPVALTDRTCEVSFPAEVMGCTADELHLRATPTRSIDSSCQTAPVPVAPWVEHRLRRLVTTDAG